MRLFVVLFSLFVSVFASAESPKHQFMPENDLWKEDSLSLFSAVDQDMFMKIIDAGLKIYSPVADANSEKLVINAKWTDSTVNANACRGCEPGKVIVNMFGGLARREEIIPEGFALVLCHELGHLYGGKPYISVQAKMAAEGQSDYYATNICYSQVAKEVKGLDEDFTSSDYIEGKCESMPERSICKHALEGGLSLGKLLSVLTKEQVPQYETPDTTIVTRTQLSYPRTTQCRTDTYHNGALNLPRPACWYKNGFAPDWRY